MIEKYITGTVLKPPRELSYRLYNLTPYEQLCKDFAKDIITEEEFNKAVALLVIDRTKHGTYYGYARQGCRCEFCKSANAMYLRRRRKKVITNLAPTHGTVYTYNYYRCRCDLCKAAKSEYKRCLSTRS